MTFLQRRSLPIVVLATSTALAICSGCRPVSAPLTPFGDTVFMDSLRASRAIIPGAEMNALLSLTDMGLQLKRCFPPDTAREQVLGLYQKSLSTEVRNFSPSEKKVLLDNLNTVAQWCHRLQPELIPPDLKLIKVSGRHYGGGAFYTRRSNIIMPGAAIERPNPDRLRRILLHELFHIFSRHHPETRGQLYEMLGFTFLEKTPSLPPLLQKKLLLNPDGLVMHAAMDLDSSSATAYAIPLLRATNDCMVEGRTDYFGYLRFDLYPIRQSGNGWEVQANDDGSSPLDYRTERVFFNHIGDVTSYIIHPDEILADHFAVLVLRLNHEQGQDQLQFSPRGEALLDKMHRILKNAT